MLGLSMLQRAVYPGSSSLLCSVLLSQLFILLGALFHLLEHYDFWFPDPVSQSMSLLLLLLLSRFSRV